MVEGMAEGTLEAEADTNRPRFSGFRQTALWHLSERCFKVTMTVGETNRSIDTESLHRRSQ